MCHCLLIETAHQLILVDTGLGLQDLREPRSLGPMSYLLGVQADTSLSAYEQVKKLGFSSADVTDLVMTHLDLDHAGGIPDFRMARVHVAGTELTAAKSRKNFRFRERYRTHHIAGDVKWQTFDSSKGEAWNGFNLVQELAGLPPEILLVGLPGHTPGHCGVVVQSGESWIMHAGDAYYDERDLGTASEQPLWTKAFARLVHTDHPEAIKTKTALANLKNDPKIQLFCSHDPKEFQAALTT